MISVRRMQPWLGTFVEIRAEGADLDQVTAAVTAAFAAIARVHQCMSYHRADSDVGRLNREANYQSVTVDPWTRQVLTYARALSAVSQGAFDITVADRLVAQGHLPATAPTAGAGCWSDVIIATDGRVRFARPVCIDLGGIAKGFAVDCAIDVLCAHGITSAVVNAGGDMRAIGSHPHRVLVRHPAAPHRPGAVINLCHQALATSAPYFSTQRCGQRLVSPLIRPHDGGCVLGPVSVSVVAAQCMHADALTKVVLADPAAAPQILAAQGATAWVLRADEAGAIASAAAVRTAPSPRIDARRPVTAECHRVLATHAAC